MIQCVRHKVEAKGTKCPVNEECKDFEVVKEKK